MFWTPSPVSSLRVLLKSNPDSAHVAVICDTILESASELPFVHKIQQPCRHLSCQDLVFRTGRPHSHRVHFLLRQCHWQRFQWCREAWGPSLMFLLFSYLCLSGLHSVVWLNVLRENNACLFHFALDGRHQVFSKRLSSASISWLV